ncbi:MAG: ATP--guanido phosphotransferase, partial [Planctomycetota bacterium]
MLDLESMARDCGEWLRASGPESDIVISSRVRLARNLTDFPFIARTTETDREQIEQILHARIDALQAAGKLPSAKPNDELHYVDVGGLEDVDRQFLVERQLISREHADADGARAVVIDGGERFSVMINEEDHLRIQVMHSGLDLETAWREI